MKIKKRFYKFGIIPIVLILIAGLFAGGAVLAEDGGVEPQAETGIGIEPDSIYNDGAHEVEIWWNVEYTGTANYSTLALYAGEAGSVPPMFIQYSDGRGTDNFTGAIAGLGNINDSSSPYNQPEYPTANHTWMVPVLPAREYQIAVKLYKNGGLLPVTASTNFDVLEATGCLKVRKEAYLTGVGQAGWRFDIYGPDDPGNFVQTVYTESDGEVTLCNLPIGEYTVVEEMQDNWTSRTPGGSEPYEMTKTVLFDTTVTVTFVNEPSPGCIWIHKYEDDTPLGSYGNNPATEPGLDNWEFKVYEASDLDTPVATVYTDSSGNYTLCDLEIGDYRVVESDIDTANWRCTDPGSSLYKEVTVESGSTAPVKFGNQQLGSIKIIKFEDLEPFGEDNDETGTTGMSWLYSIDGSGTYTTSATTGYVIISGLTPGNHTVAEKTPLPNNWINSYPETGYSQVVNVVAGSETEVRFGNRYVERLVPTLGQWGIIALSAAFVLLLIWFTTRKRRIA